MHMYHVIQSWHNLMGYCAIFHQTPNRGSVAQRAQIVFIHLNYLLPLSLKWPNRLGLGLAVKMFIVGARQQ
jgi:hypothetical protein